MHGRLFEAGGAIYFLGHKGDLRVARSTDRGETWSEPAELTRGQSWHQTAANTWKTRDHIYLVMERRTSRTIGAWPVGELAPVLMRARLGDDLTRPGSWTFASMDLDGDDLVLLARSGDRRAKCAHDGNLITFHRVRNFRALVY